MSWICVNYEHFPLGNYRSTNSVSLLAESKDANSWASSCAQAWINNSDNYNPPEELEMPLKGTIPIDGPALD
jgi:hypothetical protein